MQIHSDLDKVMQTINYRMTNRLNYNFFTIDGCNMSILPMICDNMSFDNVRRMKKTSKILTGK